MSRSRCIAWIVVQLRKAPRASGTTAYHDVMDCLNDAPGPLSSADIQRITGYGSGHVGGALRMLLRYKHAVRTDAGAYQATKKGNP